MHIFKIEVITKKPKKIWGLPSHQGRITVGNFSEIFIMSLDNWNLEEYKKQWKSGLGRMETHDISCLVTNVQNLLFNPLVFIWTLYKEGNIVYIQNHMLNKTIAEESGLTIHFSQLTYEDYKELLRPRETITEDGYPISEWSIDYKAIEEFAHSFEPCV